MQTGRLRKNYLHYTFEQGTFKKDHIKMNQKFRQNAKDSVEKVFLNFWTTPAAGMTAEII